MFYISLPYFYENFKFNQYFKNYINQDQKNNTNKLIAKFNIEYVYGTFPWSYWNGGINCHQTKTALAPDIQGCFNKTYTPIRIDASNIFLNQYDYLDIHENIILQLANGTNTVYEISDINLMNYISQKNLNNKFIISNNAQLIHSFTPEIIDVFQAQDNIDFINIGYGKTDLFQTIDKTKIEISMGHCYNCSNEKQLICSKREQQWIYNFSKQSGYIECPFEYKIVDYYKEIQPYLKQNIKHFKIITNFTNLKDFNINIIKSFVKPEYQGECIDGYYRKLLE